MSKSVFGIATTHGQAERIVEQLQAQGFAASEISVLMPDTGGTRDVGHVKATKAPEGRNDRCSYWGRHGRRDRIAGRNWRLGDSWRRSVYRGGSNYGGA